MFLISNCILFQLICMAMDVILYGVIFTRVENIFPIYFSFLPVLLFIFGLTKT